MGYITDGLLILIAVYLFLLLSIAEKSYTIQRIEFCQKNPNKTIVLNLQPDINCNEFLEKHLKEN